MPPQKKVKKGAPPPPDVRSRIRHIVHIKDIVPNQLDSTFEQHEEGDGNAGTRRFSITLPDDCVVINVGQRHDGTWFVAYARVLPL